MKPKSLLLPKIIGSITITAVMVIGIYVLILDLPKIKNKSNSENTSINSNLSQENPEDLAKDSIKDEKEQESETPQTSGTVSSGTTNPGATNPTPTTPTNPTPTYSYKNGSFTSSQSYSVPGNKTNTLTATISVDKDTVTVVSTTQVNDNRSQEYYDSFKLSLNSSVSNKKLLGLIIPDGPNAVGGASLTSAAFNLILNQVRAQAKNS